MFSLLLPLQFQISYSSYHCNKRILHVFHCLVLYLAHLTVQVLSLSLLIDSRILTFLGSAAGWGGAAHKYEPCSQYSQRIPALHSTAEKEILLERAASPVETTPLHPVQRAGLTCCLASRQLFLSRGMLQAAANAARKRSATHGLWSWADLPSTAAPAQGQSLGVVLRVLRGSRMGLDGKRGKVRLVM